MKKGAFNTKIIYNHLLAVALACIVSLLFVHKTCQFFNTSSKRLDYANITVALNGGGQDAVVPCHFEGGCNSESQTEGFTVIKNLFGYRFQSHRFIKPFPILTSLDQYINSEKNEHFKTFYRYGLPPMWGPSIPIAHRKLII